MDSARSGGCGYASDPRLVGDPVDTLTGAVFDGKLEFRLTGPLELWWWRHYDSSQSHRHYSLGWGHAHDFDRSLQFDADGIRYEGPLGRSVGFAPLLRDGAEDSSLGHRIRRVSAYRYELLHHGEPGMEFQFPDPEQPARLTRLFRGDDEIRFEYAGWRLHRIIDSVRRVLNVSHDPAGRLAKLELERARGETPMLLLAYTYDERGRAVAATHGSGHGYRFEYDDANRMLRRTGRKGFCFHFTYDEQGRCIKATGDDRLYEVSLEYVIPGRVTRVTRADGGVWTYFFDEVGALVQVHDPLGGVEEFVRDKTGRLAVRVDPAGNATRIVSDGSGAPTAEISPLGHLRQLPQDPNAPDPLSHRVAANAAEYELGRLLDVSEIVVPDQGTLHSLRLPAHASRLVSVRPRAELDSDGLEAYEVRPLGVRWWPEPRRGWRFNDFGKLVEQVDAFGRRRRWTYDGSGNVAVSQDFDGQDWVYDYGSWHFLRALRNPAGAEVRYTHTPQGSIASFTDAGGSRSEYSYDAKDQLLEVRRHGTVRETYARDAAGNLLAKFAADGRELLRMEIGGANLPVKKTLASGDEHSFEYDAFGRPTRVTTKKDATELTYDGLGNCTSEKRNGRGVEIVYAGFRSPTEVTLFDRFVVRYQTRDGGRVVVDPGGHDQQIGVLGHGIVERRLSNGSSEIAQYDDLGRTRFKLTSSLAGIAWQRRYEWSGEGELRVLDDDAQGTIRHEYDAAHRLRRRIANGRAEDYHFDMADNLLRQPGLEDVAIESGNRIVAANGYRLTYNDRNHVGTRETAEGTVRYFYDSRDQLVMAETPLGRWEADYDPFGRRTRKVWAGRTTEYYWSGDQLGAEVEQNGRLRVYVYADPLALTPLLVLDYESVDSATDSCARYFVFSDQLGTPCLLQDDRGREVWRATVEPFGRCQVSKTARIEFNLRLPGHYFDAELGLHYNRFRYFEPTLGRYLQSDPWGIAGGFNLYGYRPNPLASVDVRGLGEENDPACKAKPDEEATGAPTGSKEAPQIVPGSNREMLGQAVKLVGSHPGDAAAKAALFEQLAPQISQHSGGTWTAQRSSGTDGSHIFLGSAGEALVISPSGQMYRGSLQNGGIRIAGPKSFEPDYSKLRPL